MTFDPWRQVAINAAYGKLKTVQLPDAPEPSLDDLKKLAGTNISGEITVTQDFDLAPKKAKFAKDNNIKPGDRAWFKLWFANPKLTGEDPFS